MKVTPAPSNQLLKRFRVPLTELPLTFLSPPNMYKTGTSKICQRTKESHSMTGSLRIKKLLRSFFF